MTTIVKQNVETDLGKRVYVDIGALTITCPVCFNEEELDLSEHQMYDYYNGGEEELYNECKSCDSECVVATIQLEVTATIKLNKGE